MPIHPSIYLSSRVSRYPPEVIVGGWGGGGGEGERVKEEKMEIQTIKATRGAYSNAGNMQPVGPSPGKC